MTLELEMNSLDLESESVEIEDLKVEDFLDFARFGDADALKSIFDSEYASKLAVSDKNKNSLLHMTAANGHFECASLLLKCPQVLETSLNSVNTEGNTPLHWAALNSHVNLVRLLLEHGANINIKNNVGQTPFDEAIANEKFEVTTAIIEFLETIQNHKEEAASSSHLDTEAEEEESRNLAIN